MLTAETCKVVDKVGSDRLVDGGNAMTDPFLCVMCLSVLSGGVFEQSASGTATTDQIAAIDETPSQFYMRYRAAVHGATTLDQVMAFWRTVMVNEFKQAPADQRADLAAFKRIYGMLSEIKVSDAKMTSGGAGATLTITAKASDGKAVTGTAEIVREEGRWKLVGPESWQ